MPSNHNSRTTQVAVAVLSAAVVAGYAGQRNSFARPEYAMKEGLRCNYCHLPGQAHERNYRGKFYEKDHKFEDFDDYAASVAAGTEPLPPGKAKPSSLTGLAPLTTAHDRVTSAMTAYKAKTDDPALKKAYVDSLTDLSKAVLDSKVTPAKAKFTAASKVASDALGLDPGNATATELKKTADEGVKAEEAKEKEAAPKAP